MNKHPQGLTRMSRVALNTAREIARPQISARLKDLGNQIQTALGRKTSQKIHLKIDFRKDDAPAIEVSGAGLLALEYGRRQVNGEGVVSEVISELQSENREVSHDE